MEKTEGVLELELVSLVAGCWLVLVALLPNGGSGKTGDGTEVHDTGGEGDTPETALPLESSSY